MPQHAKMHKTAASAVEISHGDNAIKYLVQTRECHRSASACYFINQSAKALSLSATLSRVTKTTHSLIYSHKLHVWIRPHIHTHAQARLPPTYHCCHFAVPLVELQTLLLMYAPLQQAQGESCHTKSS